MTMTATSPETSLIEYRLRKARETLDAAHSLLDSQNLRDSISRLYFAQYYAVTALLLTKGFTTTEHFPVKELFNRDFVDRGLVDKQWAEYYEQSFKDRLDGDYTDHYEFDQGYVRERLRKAWDFMSAIADAIQSSLGY
ncbi:MAG: HEPN domain-containing protein [Chloroflexi bacterium]|nr:HEPN domain-containing protein [Chloroflexota bacterium]